MTMTMYGQSLIQDKQTFLYIQNMPLEDAELAQLASKISSLTMRNMAVQRMGFTDAEVETLSDECREKQTELHQQNFD